MIVRLVCSQWRLNKVRLVLAVSAMAACSCMLVWMMGSYSQLIASYNEDAQKNLGHYQVVVNAVGQGRGAVVPASPQHTLLSELKKALLQDDAVLAVDDALQLPGYVVSEAKHLSNPLSHRARIGIPSQGPMIVGLDAERNPFDIEEGRWLVPSLEKASNADSVEASKEMIPEAVIGSAAAELLGVQLGSCVVATVNARIYVLRIVGIVEQKLSSPDIGRDPAKGSGPPLASLYVEKGLAEKMAEGGRSSELLFIQLKQGVRVDSFCERWGFFGSKGAKPALQFTTAKTLEERLNNNRGARHEAEQANWALWMSLLSASFIIFTALNIGVDERLRQFRTLRCIGMHRGHIVSLILVESLMLSFVGWMIGVLAALVLLDGFSWESLQKTLNVSTLVPSLLCAFIGALVAAIIPAWRAARIRPLDSAGVVQVGHQKQILWMAGIGLLCFIPLTLSFCLTDISVESRLDLFYWFGCPFAAVGMILWTPMIVVLVEKIAASFLAKCLRLPVSLLKLQLSQHLWRSVGTVISLSLGLGLFVAVQTWGASMLVPFMPNEQLPRVLASFLPNGLPSDSPQVMRALQDAAKCDSSEILAAASEQPRIAVAQRTSAAFSAVRQDNVVLMGVDVQTAFKGDNAFFKFEWKDGDKAKSLEDLDSGRACLIPDSLQTATGLQLGDELMLEGPQKQILKYKVAGVIHIPGWHWLSKRSGMRRNGGFTAALVFADIKQVREDFPRASTPCFWFNFTHDMDDAAWTQFDQSMQDIAGQYMPIAEAGGMGLAQKFCHVVTLDALQKDISERASSVIWASCYLPMIAFAITLLAVVNTIIASIRAREREFGILRALGLTRRKMMALVLAESCIIAWVACSLSLVFGLVSAWGFASMSNYTSYFGAMSPPFVFPWLLLLITFSLSSLLCIVCAIFPTLSLGRKEPTQLLEQMKIC